MMRMVVAAMAAVVTCVIGGCVVEVEEQTGESVEALGWGCTVWPSLCDDDNDCTADSCVGGKCEHTLKADGVGCADDGTACTADYCHGGECSHPPKTSGEICYEPGCGQGTCYAPFVDPDGTVYPGVCYCAGGAL